MTKPIPTTGDIRVAYAQDFDGEINDTYAAEFDAWLDAFKAEIRAERDA